MHKSHKSTAKVLLFQINLIFLKKIIKVSGIQSFHLFSCQSPKVKLREKIVVVVLRFEVSVIFWSAPLREKIIEDIHLPHLCCTASYRG